MNNFCQDCGKRNSFDLVHTCTPPSQRPQNCGTSYCSCIECPYPAPVVPAHGVQDLSRLIADAQRAFDALYPLPEHCTRFDGGYASTGYSAWMAHDHCKKWEGWKAAWLGKIQPPQQSAQPDVPETDCGNIATLIEECRDALAEELAGWDLDPPLHHVKQAHDKCVDWLSNNAAAQPVEVQRVGLTDEDILRIDCMSDRTWVLLFARAIERAHGIKPASKGGA